MKRLFAFGCSFTEYHWPTWADLLGREFEIFENWGSCAAGNLYIFNQLIECNLKKCIKSEDTICIMWTNVVREDTYINNKWRLKGNQYNNQKIKDHNNNWDIRGYYIRDLALIQAAKMILDSIGCKYYFFSMVPMLNVDQYSQKKSDDISDLMIYYKPLLDIFYPSVFEAVFNNNWHNRPLGKKPGWKSLLAYFNSLAGESWPELSQILDNDFTNTDESVKKEILDKSRWDWQKMYFLSKRADLHPTPNEHIEYLKIVAPELYNLLSDETKQWANKVTITVDQNLNNQIPLKSFGWQNPNIPKKF